MRLSSFKRKFARATWKCSRTVSCSFIHSDNHRRFLSYALYASCGLCFPSVEHFFILFPVFLLFINTKGKSRSLLKSVHHLKLIFLPNLIKEKDKLSRHLCKIWMIITWDHAIFMSLREFEALAS